MTGMNYETGSLVTVRGRDWIVLPPLHDDALLIKPLGGVDAEIVEISPLLENVQAATFSLPDPQEVGDARTCAILRDAVRLGLRSSTGPFRSFGHIAVEPRPYQLVPLLMAMKQDTVRLLIADDVGIGKTVEALLIARELQDRGEVRRMTVLCPPQLAEQWQKEMAEKFHIEAELVLPSTINRLERGLGAGTSLFEKYACTIVSLDFIKSDRHRLDFIRACPELVIVDEAHTCASPSGSRGRKQRYELVRELARSKDRHMLLVTATPHSGKDDVFRSLLALLREDFASLPEDLGGRENEKSRRELAQYLVQRRRGDIRAYMDAQTPFPERKTNEITWEANAEWRELFDKSLNLARDSIASQEEGDLWQQRICWWSALALLRAVSSSPAAAEQTLLARAFGTEDVQSVEQLDTLGSQAVFDLDSGDEAAILDTLPGADASKDADEGAESLSADSGRSPSGGRGSGKGPRRSRYKDLANLAASLKGNKDEKLQALVPHLRTLLHDGYSPVIFCRFIPTAEYLTEELRKALPRCDIAAVTGILPPAEREARVLDLARSDKRILVCTDCLSEGINLQESFNAVVHYDLSWNPTRHEQREGRVDRFGQSKKDVRILTWWGKDNPMDGMVLDVLLRKHESIRRSLGVSVPVPEDSEKVVETLLKGLLLRRHRKGTEERKLELPGVADFRAEGRDSREKEELFAIWDGAVQKERRSRTLFAQASIRTEEVAVSLAEANEACGSSQAVERFVSVAWPLLGGAGKVEEVDGQRIRSFSFDEVARARYPGLELPDNDARFVFSPPAKRRQTCLVRTHPLVEQLASWLAQTALEPQEQGVLARCGVMRTRSVQGRTTLILCRLRFQIVTSGEVEHSALAEECVLLAFEGAPQKARWLDGEAMPGLLAAEPAENVAGNQASGWIGKVEEGIQYLLPHIEEFHKERAAELLREHRSVRDAARWRNVRYRVQAQGKPDILGIFVYLPVISD